MCCIKKAKSDGYSINTLELLAIKNFLKSCQIALSKPSPRWVRT